MATSIDTHTSTFSFSAPYPSSSAPKQRRVSLATPASEREVPAFKFRDDTGLPSPSDERRGKVRRLTSPAPPEKKARKKWTMEETQMLVEGCNRVSIHPSLCGVSRAHFASQQHGVGNWKAILNDTSLHFDNRSPVDLKDRSVHRHVFYLSWLIPPTASALTSPTRISSTTPTPRHISLPKSVPPSLMVHPSSRRRVARSAALSRRKRTVLSRPVMISMAPSGQP